MVIFFSANIAQNYFLQWVHFVGGLITLYYILMLSLPENVKKYYFHLYFYSLQF